MFQVQRDSDPQKNYESMLYAAKRILADDRDMIAVLANLSAVINAYMDRINWVGFYLMKNDELVLGPFQGLPACVRLQVGKGVCGTAVAERKTQIVDDVHTFHGHIACDSASNSEIVIPIYVNDTVFGVLDVDSPEFSRFGDLEAQYLSDICLLIGEHLVVDEVQIAFVSRPENVEGCFSCGKN